ncbi:ricin B lectin domain-containing protein [Tanacetum coccineum]
MWCYEGRCVLSVVMNFDVMISLSTASSSSTRNVQWDIAWLGERRARGKVVLAPAANPYDPLQHWIKDDNVGLNVKDEEGFPSFALINKATGQAIKHSIGVNYPVRLKKYNPDKLDKSVLWTMSKKLDDGYRAVSAVDNTHLKLDAAFRDIKKHDGGHDDADIVLCDWHGGNNQRWTIISYYRLVRNLDV